MCDAMNFQQTVDEFMESYKIIDSDHVYTNGAEMVPIFRMKQWFEHEAQMKLPKSLLDHIHNVVRDEAYRQGYEQGKKDAAIPDASEDQKAKADAGKLDLTLVPIQIVEDIAEVRMYGNKKYGDPDNWKTVDKERYVKAFLRHTIEYLKNRKGKDKESNIKHYKHMACNMAFICEMEAWEDAKEDET